MDDRAKLLNQLKIDRAEDDRPRSSAWVWLLGTAIVAIAASAFAWRYWLAETPIVVAVATAESIATEAAPLRGSALDASGYVVARRQATVSSKITGRVVEVLIEEGQIVEADEIVARLDDTNARARVIQAVAMREQQRANLNAVRVAFENAVPTFARNQEQFAQQVISAQTFDNAKAAYDAARTSLEVAERAVEVADANLALAQRDLDDTIVRSPFAGVVTVKAAQEGEMVSPVSAGGGFTRTGIGTIVDMDSLEVEVDVSENFINRVTADQDVTVRLNAYPDWSIPARVIAIIPTADRAKATVRVRVGFLEKDPRILPQMGVRVAFLAEDDAQVTRSAQNVVLIPHEAVQVNGDTGIVFVIRDDTLERRSVRLGGQTNAGRIVLSGLTAGTRLAVADLAALEDGLRVRTGAPQ